MDNASRQYTVLLDGRPVKTRAGHTLSTPSPELAQELANEWNAQIEKIDPETMPLTQILNTKIDNVSHEREAMTKAVLKYLDTDLLCYRAQNPKELGDRQEHLWVPWCAWLEGEYGVRVQTTTGLQALKQEPELHEAISKEVAAMNDDQFMVLQLMTPLAGSLVLALAFIKGKAAPDDVLQAIFVEENYKDELYDAQKYGSDPMQEKSRKSKERDVRACLTYLQCLKHL